MSLLHSDWLIRMLEKSSQSPEQRLLQLFTLLNDWLDAPNLAEYATQETDRPTRLLEFMRAEALNAGADMPEMLANQLYFIALAAMQEKISTRNPLSLLHARSAAQALIRAQTRRSGFRHPTLRYGVAASLLVALTFIGTSAFYQHQLTDMEAPHVAPQQAAQTPMPMLEPNTTASPTQTAALFAKIEQMRKGECQLIEALMLPEQHKAVYFENIVRGEISTNLKDQKLVHELLEKVRCNYKPMLMMSSK